MKYVIDWMERKKTSTGKEKIDANLTGENNSKEEKVTIWSDFPGFEELAPGRDLVGDVVTKQNGQYLNKTLYPIRHKPLDYTVPTGVGKFGGISKAQDRKKADIEYAQEKKSESIKISSTFSSAINILTAFYPEISELYGKEREDAWRDKFNQIREYLISKWDVTIDPMDTPPFP